MHSKLAVALLHIVFTQELSLWRSFYLGWCLVLRHMEKPYAGFCPEMKHISLTYFGKSMAKTDALRLGR